LTNNWINENYDEVKNLKKYLKLEFHREYEIGQDVSHYLKNNMNQDIDDFVECIICICMIKYFVHSGEDRTIAIIIAHGYSTASSIAEAANRMLNSYIFDAIDMPLDVDVQAITRKINDYIAYVGNISKLYLLVDMGSLEEIYQGLDTSNADIALVNNINTKCALEIGQGIKLNKTVTEVIDSILKENIYKTHVELKKKKEPIVICSCASGLGAAHKIKEILFNSLPEDTNLKIITYDYPALIRKQVYDQLMNDYEVVCVIGTLDPNIESMKYIGIQELIINEGQNAIEIYFGKYMKKEQMEIFEKNILRNFTLSNVMNNLTILNPDKLLEHVAKAIDHLQNILHKRFKNRTCFGLYVHICCLVERLVTRQAISNFTDQGFKEKHQEFIDQVNISMKEVKTYYNVEIPDEEVEYIYNYIIND
jgi:sigma-54 dependent transcriptional regulator of gfr operon